MNKKTLVFIIIAIIVVSLTLYLYSQYGGKIISVEKSPVTNDQNQTFYTIEEITLHSFESDCWIIINNKVYNVTEFIPFHPGGKIILNSCGKEATVLFETRPTNLNTPHPEQAFEKLNDYYIGDLQK